MPLSNEQLIERWGISKHYRNFHWFPSEEIEHFMRKWVNEFPQNVHQGILFIASEDVHQMVPVAEFVNALLMLNKIEQSVHIINIPSFLVRFGNTIDEQVESIQVARRATVDTDLVVFADLGLTKLNPDQVNLVYDLIQRRVTTGKSFMITLPVNTDELIENVGKGLATLVSRSHFIQVIML